MNPYVNFVMPSVRVVAKLYREMTPEQEAHLREHNHLLYFNILHMVRALDTIDESAASVRRDLAQAQRQVAELDE